MRGVLPIAWTLTPLIQVALSPSRTFEHSTSSWAHSERCARRFGGSGTPRELCVSAASRVQAAANVRVRAEGEGEGEQDGWGRRLSRSRRWEETKKHGGGGRSGVVPDVCVWCV